MTKKDYERLALAVQSAHLTSTLTRTYAEALAHAEGVNDAAARIASTLAEDSPRFDRDRFLRACVPGANVRARS